MRTTKKREDTLINVARMYYLQGMTQDAIATVLDTSRSNVSRLIRLCIDEGIVEFKIKGTRASFNPTLDRQLQEKYKLDHAIVVKTESSLNDTTESVAKAAASYFVSILQSGQKIGISWGSTLQKFVTEVHKLDPLPTCNIFQLAGGYSAKLTYGDSFSIVKTLSDAIHGECYLIQAPFIVENEVLKALIMQEDDMKRHFQQLSTLDIAIAGIGTIEPPDSSLYRSGCLTLDECNYIHQQGGVCDFCGCQIKADGEECITEFRNRIIGVPL